MLRNLLNQAQKQGWAIGHFNFSILEQLRGIANAAKKLKAPVILAVSEGEAEFLGLEETVALVRILESKINHSLFLHLDHGKDLGYIKRAIDFGFDSVHFDGSELSFKENIKRTKQIVDYSHKKKILVEGELGYLRGASKLFLKEKPKIKKNDLTKPKQVQEFVAKTGIDSLAIAIGSVHGRYQGPEKIDFERLKEIRAKTNVFLVLHGGSGIPAEHIKKAIKLGIQKININTDLRIIWRDSLKKALNKTQEVKPYKILPQTEKAIQNKVEKYIKLFNSQNKFTS